MAMMFFHVPMGSCGGEEQIDSIQDKRLSPSLREEMKDAVRKSNDVQHQRWVEENRQFNFVRLRKEVDAYDPASDPDGVRFQALSLAVTRDLPADLRAEVGGELDAKFRGLKSDPPRGVKAMVRRVADSLFDEGKFGQWKGRVDDTRQSSERDGRPRSSARSLLSRSNLPTDTAEYMLAKAAANHAGRP